MHVAHLHACAAQTAHRCASCAYASAERKHLHQSQQGGGGQGGSRCQHHNIIVRSIVTQLAFVHQIVKSDRLIARLHASRPLMTLFCFSLLMSCLSWCAAAAAAATVVAVVAVMFCQVTVSRKSQSSDASQHLVVLELACWRRCLCLVLTVCYRAESRGRSCGSKVGFVCVAVCVSNFSFLEGQV